jgi:serine/threonine-protein kinase HipA
LDLELTLEVAGYFRLTNENALKIIGNIKKSVTNWRSIANKYQLPRSEQELMANVFERFL